MNLNRAKYILMILEEGSISAAAHKLFLSQAALSQTVRLVEEEVGLPILERENGTLKLTFAGERYVDTAKQIMLLEKNFRNEIDEIKREQRGQFRFGIPYRNGQIILPQIIPDLLREYPSVQLKIKEKGSPQLTKMIAQGDLDLAVIRTASFEDGIVYRLLQKEQLGILAGRGSRIFERFSDGTEVDIKEVTDELFVFLKDGHSSRDSQERLLKRNHVKLRSMVEIDNFETAKLLVINSGAAMITPFSALQLSEEQKAYSRFYPLKDAEEEGSIYLIHHEALYLTPYMRCFMELIRGIYECGEKNMDEKTDCGQS